MEKHFISADSLLRDSMELARLIIRSGLRPTFLVAMWRGGAPIGITSYAVLKLVRGQARLSDWLVYLLAAICVARFIYLA